MISNDGIAIRRIAAEMKGPSRPRGAWTPNKCWRCGAADSRNTLHAQGCPVNTPLPKKELVRLARIVEAGWRIKVGKRKRDV